MRIICCIFSRWQTIKFVHLHTSGIDEKHCSLISVKIKTKRTVFILVLMFNIISIHYYLYINKSITVMKMIRVFSLFAIIQQKRKSSKLASYTRNIFLKKSISTGVEYFEYCIEKIFYL